MIQVHFAGESLKEEGRGLNATKALCISSVSPGVSSAHHKAYFISGDQLLGTGLTSQIARGPSRPLTILLATSG